MNINKPLSSKEIKHAANAALKHGYKVKDIESYFRDKGYKPLKIRKIIYSTDYIIYQSTYQLLAIIGIVNFSLGITWAFFHPPFLTTLGIQYLHVVYGIVLIISAILTSKKIGWAYVLAIILILVDISITISLLGSVENIIGPLFAKLLLFYWLAKGFLPILRLRKN